MQCVKGSFAAEYCVVFESSQWRWEWVCRDGLMPNCLVLVTSCSLSIGVNRASASFLKKCYECTVSSFIAWTRKSTWISNYPRYVAKPKFNVKLLCIPIRHNGINAENWFYENYVIILSFDVKIIMKFEG